jgi:hypothetical protein
VREDRGRDVLVLADGKAGGDGVLTHSCDLDRLSDVSRGKASFRPA